MDSATAEKTARHIQSLLDCPGWKDWLLPLFAKLKEEIKEKLTQDLSPEETAKLRSQHKNLKEIEAKPAQHLAQMKEILAARAQEEE